MTPHIEAQKGDYASTVLMPGDPLRAKWIAETFLTDYKRVNAVRNCLGYTGYYNDKKISVQASGMGQPSLGIYAHELYNFYDVETIIRVGSCGALSKDIRVGDIVVAMTAMSDTGMTKNWSPNADYQLLKNFVDQDLLNCHVGTIFSADYFYNPDQYWWKPLAEAGVLAVEMEAHLLYTLAMRFSKKALAVSTVSDHLAVTSKVMSSTERQESFNIMVEAVLDSVC